MEQLVWRRRDGRLVALIVEGEDGGLVVQVAADAVVAPLTVGAPVRVRVDVDEIVFADGELLDSELADARGRPAEVHPADPAKRRAESVGHPDGDGPLLDVLASEARTALTDPAAVGLPYRDGVNDYDPQAAVEYAVDRLDRIISSLNPAEETTGAYAGSLTVIGRQLAERLATIEQDELTYAEHSEATMESYLEAANALAGALDLVDEAINSLAPEAEALDERHDVVVTRRGSGWGIRCSCGYEPARSSRRRRDAERWARWHRDEMTEANVAAATWDNGDGRSD